MCACEHRGPECEVARHAREQRGGASVACVHSWRIRANHALRSHALTAKGSQNSHRARSVLCIESVLALVIVIYVPDINKPEHLQRSKCFFKIAE